MNYEYQYVEDIDKEMNSLNDRKDAPPMNYGLAVASLIIGAISLVFFLFGLNILSSIIAIIFGAVFLGSNSGRGVKKGKALAVTGILTAIASIVLCIGCWTYMFSNADNIILMMNDGIFFNNIEDYPNFDSEFNFDLDNELQDLEPDDTL
ncbi:DUF4190 domain-containing protein [Pseudobutyrivibrio xylanivorans]|uniref:DUF4190 domain-containing protein n=1 Tax=Pseudobutyrivibrio xylanivorans TaxID=185007 RepID=A0A5P6VPG4_PSEXY|nr:DUF4190 domain-containing protein [Pseudobutyrivibrio xylanivorans]QFJ54556.1 DUF4190 domain-containing protein [Pseudobutyrivibrio xylanivorans]